MPVSYRADHGGSFLRPTELLEARAKGTDAARLRALEDEQILRLLAKQKELGFEIFTDGELRRSNFMSGLTDALEGFYLGGAGTYNMGDFNNSRNGYAMGGQLYTGYNWQAGQIVYGVEADLGYSGLDHSAGGITEKNRFNGSVRGRVGYDLNPFLLYGTAGLAATNNKVSGLGDSDSKMAYGYTVGVGAEAFVTSNITARVEYRFSDYQDKDYNLGGTNVSRGYDEQSVKVGIGVKF